MKNLIGREIFIEEFGNVTISSQSCDCFELMINGDQSLLSYDTFEKEIKSIEGNNDEELVFPLIGKIVKDIEQPNLSLHFKVIDQFIGYNNDVYIQYGYDKDGYYWGKQEGECVDEGWASMEVFNKYFKEL